MIIEANWGLGESVVSGELMPDVCILNKENLKIHEKKVGVKLKHVIFKDMGVVEEETPPEMKSAFCLRDEEMSEIGRLGKILEEHFGGPQDVEWAVDQESAPPNNIVLLQTRTAIIAQKKAPVDQVVDLMVNLFSKG
jgi:pyruvate,water dikinase